MPEEVPQAPANPRTIPFKSATGPNPLPGMPISLEFHLEYDSPPKRAPNPSHEYRVILVLQKPGRAELAENQIVSPEARSGASGVRALTSEGSSQFQEFVLRFPASPQLNSLEFVGVLNQDGCLATFPLKIQKLKKVP
jgi:hypothetical protein